MLRRSLSEPYNIVLAKYGGEENFPPPPPTLPLGENSLGPPSAKFWDELKVGAWESPFDTPRLCLSTDRGTTRFKTHRRVYVPHSAEDRDSKTLGRGNSGDNYERRLYLLEPRKNGHTFVNSQGPNSHGPQQVSNQGLTMDLKSSRARGKGKDRWLKRVKKKLAALSDNLGDTSPNNMRFSDINNNNNAKSTPTRNPLKMSFSFLKNSGCRGPFLVDDRGYACKLKRFQRPSVPSNHLEDNDKHIGDPVYDVVMHCSSQNTVKKLKSMEPIYELNEITTTTTNTSNSEKSPSSTTGHGGSTLSTKSEGISLASCSGKFNLGIHRLVVERGSSSKAYLNHPVLLGRLNSSWDNPLGRSLKRDNHRTLLDNISLEVNEGEMFVLLGNKESGKTLLLDVIMDRSRTKGMQIFGKFHLNNIIIDHTLLKHSACYIKKDEDLLPFLTTYEMLLYFASLNHYAAHKSKQLLHKIVESIMDELKLHTHRNTFIKHLTINETILIKIACQIILEKDTILFDEPDQGLEHHVQNFILEYFRKLSSRGKIIICSMYNISFGAYLAFNKAAILTNGCMVYYGLAKEIVPYFESVGFRNPYYANPCEYYVDLSTVDQYSIKSFQKSIKRVKMLQELCTAKSLSNIPSTVLTELSEDVCGVQSIDVPPNISWWNRTLNMIYLIHSPRQRMLKLKSYIGEVFFFIFLSVLIGGIFYDIKTTQLSLFDRLGLLFTITALLPMVIMFKTLRQSNTYWQYYAIAFKESYFGPSTFTAISFLSDLVPNVLMYTMLVSPAYWISGLHSSSETFATYTIYTVLTLVYYKIVAITFSAFYLLRPNIGELSYHNPTKSLLTLSYLIFGFLTFVGSTTGAILNICQILRGYMSWTISWLPLTPVASIIFRSLAANEFDASNEALRNMSRTCNEKFIVSEHPIRVNGILIVKNMTVQKVRECRDINLVHSLVGLNLTASQSQPYPGVGGPAWNDILRTSTYFESPDRTNFVAIYVIIHILICVICLFVRLKCLPKR